MFYYVYSHISLFSLRHSLLDKFNSIIVNVEHSSLSHFAVLHRLLALTKLPIAKMVSPMNSMLVICILGFSLLLKVVVADVFTAVIKMECLVKVEKKMLNALDVYIEESQRAREVVPESVVPYVLQQNLS